MFIDTNVLLYAVGINQDRAKMDAAAQLIDRDDCVFSVQVFNEFVNQATRKIHDRPLSFSEATAFVRSLTRFPVVSLDVALFSLAVDLKAKMTVSWWDSLIVAAAITAGCETLATEDMQHGRVIDGVCIENPFRELA